MLGADKDLAVQAATESQTLLKNDGNVLPLSTGLGKVVVDRPQRRLDPEPGRRLDDRAGRASRTA